MDHGPEYRRMTDYFRRFGARPIEGNWAVEDTSRTDATLLAGGELSSTETAILKRVYAEYAPLPTSTLATLTRADGTPWWEVYSAGRGRGRDIAHGMIRAQFEQFAIKRR
jgi:uncharacterized phage-associated protein